MHGIYKVVKLVIHKSHVKDESFSNLQLYLFSDAVTIALKFFSGSVELE